ncbi:MAG: hypothetical protein AAFY82_09695 [Pseudomonadota bacterium]
MSEIRIAVIGAHALDTDHRNALNALSDYGRIAVYAMDIEALDQGREALARAVDLKAIDAAIIAGSRSELTEWIAFSLQAGWPVYTPFAAANTVEDMVAIRRIEQQNPGAILQFGLNVRHHESVAAACAKAETGEYGQLLTMRGVCGLAGLDETDSLTLGAAVEMVDLMQIFAGPFQDVTGFADLQRTADPGTETNVIAGLRTFSGVLANLHASATQWRPTFRLELGFERGYLWLEGLNCEAYGFGPEALVHARSDGTGPHHETVDQFRHSNGVKTALDQFLARIVRPHQRPVSTSQDAFDALNTIQRILAADPIYAPIQERQVS